MISALPHRPASTMEESHEELCDCSGRPFDPDIVKVFCESLPDVKDIFKKKKAE
jgi:HD-GYP domain-containing protein (c-di-GMP phosphodiesterase class II)